MTTMCSKKYRVLLVEDDDAARRGLQLLLGSCGYDVLAHASADRLASDPAALNADCLIADLSMYPKNAFELLGELRSAGWRGRSIVITGNVTENWIDRAKASGFDAALPKPIGDRILLRTIETLLPKHF